jgi:nitroreductase
MSTTTTDLAVFDRALWAATRAPSVHNTQPWRFVVTPPRIELYLDRERVLAVADPDAREARVSCGAALVNLRVALQSSDRAVVVDTQPDPTRPDLLARVRLAGARPATPELRSLAAAIDQWATNRRPFTDRAVPAKHRTALVRAAALEGAHLALLDSPRALGEFATLLSSRNSSHGPAARPRVSTVCRAPPAALARSAPPC